jgi:hypothetical protein
MEGDPTAEAEHESDPESVPKLNESHLTPMASSDFVGIKIGIVGTKLVDIKAPSVVTRKRFEGLILGYLGVECDCDWVDYKGLQLKGGEIFIIKEDGRLRERFKTKGELIKLGGGDHSYLDQWDGQEEEPDCDLAALQEEIDDDPVNFSDDYRVRLNNPVPRKDWRGNPIEEKEFLRNPKFQEFFLVWYPDGPFAFEKASLSVRDLLNQAEEEGQGLIRGEVRRQIGDDWIKMSDSQIIRAGTVAIVEGKSAEDCEPITALIVKREDDDEDEPERELQVSAGYYSEVIDEIEDQLGEKPIGLWRGTTAR